MEGCIKQHLPKAAVPMVSSHNWHCLQQGEYHLLIHRVQPRLKPKAKWHAYRFGNRQIRDGPPQT